MASDPRPRTARRIDGTEDTDLELRFDAIFRAIRNLDTGSTEEGETLARSLAALESKVQTVQESVTTLKTDVTGLRTDLNSLAARVAVLEGYHTPTPPDPVDP